MSYLSYEIRDGVRGGRDQFKWDNVRQMAHKDREQYLGQTLMIGFLDKGGKWRKKDWYLKSKNQQEQEINDIQQNDQKRIRIALGLEKEEKTKKLTEQEQNELLNQIQYGAQNQQNFEGEDEEIEQQGLGFKTKSSDIQQKKIDMNRFLNFNPNKLDAEGIEKEEKQQKEHKEKAEKKKKIKKEKKSKKENSKKDSKKKRKHKKEKKHKKRHDSSSSSDSE